MNATSHLRLIFTFVSLSLFSILPVFLNAQTNDTSENHLTVRAQFQPRLEIRDGAFRPLSSTENPAVLISQRTRLTVDYTYKNIVALRISPQSVSVWGQANTVQGTENSGNRLALFETWARLRLSDQWSVKLGRQVISLDDERFFGELDWAQGGRTHDALTLQYDKNRLVLKGFLAYNQNYKAIYGNNINNPSGNLYSTNDAFSYKLMQTIWAGFSVDKKSTLSFLATNLGLQQADAANDDAKTYYSQTFGANYFLNGTSLTGNVSAYFQTGKNISGNRTQAYLLAAFAGYHFTKKWYAGAGTDWVSGNNTGQSQTKNRAFIPYFHTGHKFYGNMDYFYAGSFYKNVGLSDNYIKLQYKPGNSSAVSVALHQFYSPAGIVEAGKHYAKNMGQEIDISCAFKLNTFTNLSGGYSFYLPTSTLKYLKNTPDAKNFQQWGWISLNIIPTIFKSNY